MGSGVKNGSCLCGKVRFTATGEPFKLNICHCVSCRKQSGHLWAGVFYRANTVDVTGSDALGWYATSTDGKRGFCKTCGSFLFWRADHSDVFAIAGGVFDDPVNFPIGQNIFVGEKGAYYDITDTAPQYQGARND